MRIDLRTKIVGEEDQVWVVFPGRRRRFFEEFHNTSRLFLELPSLGLSQVIDDNGKYDHVALARRIGRSMAYGAYEDDRWAGRATEKPTADLSKYKGATESNRIRTMFGCVRGLFERMKPGDLVLVPAKGSYGQVLFGEVVGEFSSKDNIQIDRYGEQPLNTRKVKWIRTIPERRELPRDIAKHLERPPAVHQIKRSLKSDGVYGVAYDSYITHLTAETVVRAPRYKGLSPLETVNLHRLLAIISAIHYASKSEATAAEIRELSLDELVKNYLPEVAFDEYQLSFSSPGFIKAKSKEIALALFLTAGVAVTIAGVTDQPGIYSANSKGNIRKSIQQDMDCSLQFMQNTMSDSQRLEVTKLAKDVKEQMNISTSAVVEGSDNEKDD